MSHIILASKSAIRGQILGHAGIVFTAIGSNVDEQTEKTRLLQEGATPAEIASALADAKACDVSRNFPGWTIGADQTLDLDGQLFDKAKDFVEARARLLALRGREHWLHSAVSVAESGQIRWRHSESVSLRMRYFSETFLDYYMANFGSEVLSSVGCYQLEKEGLQLFDSINGDYFSILGLPMLRLMEFLRTQELLIA